MTALRMDRRTVMRTGAGFVAAGIGGLLPEGVGAAMPERRVLWAANVRTKSLDERLVAAQAGGFSHMSVFPIDWRGWTEGGLTRAQLRTRLREAGVRVLAIDPYVQWTPGFAIPDGYPADYRGFIDFPQDAILRIAEDLEAEAVNCVEGLAQPHPEPALIDALGAFADRAAEAGLRVTFEFMPISSVPGLAEGWSLVRMVDRPNCGLCFDTWHYFRSGAAPELLETVPGARIFEVQLADALTALQAPTLTEDLLRFRRLPGEGEFDIAGISAALKRIGAWRSVGPEVFADAMDALDAEEAGRRCGASLTRWSDA